ncbi:unnamed protein product [Sphagnum jensenii]|uniref:RING-type E3 ubiquitin transferase n=1 Tax=Sphagnum jensenii TaxID=128206 RepID=A0ABP0WC50_9BRYO
MENEMPFVVQSLIDLVNTIALKGDFIKSHKKECAALSRRVKLLVPLFEELRESRQRIPQTVLPCFYALEDALQSANKLLQMCHSGSKLYLVLERQAVAEQFQKVTDYLSQTLDALPYAKLDISDEVREQVELLHNQLTRAKGRVDSHELQLYTDLVSVLKDKDNEPAGVAALQRLAQKLELKTSGAIRQENRALQEMMLENENQLDGCESDMNFPELFSVCRKLTSILPAEDGEDSDTPELDRVNIAAGVFTPKPGPTKHDEVRVGSGPEKRALYGNETNAGEKAGHPAIPDDFKCPISLEMMKDPVIVATGQTYERSCIQKWLESGHRSCPKTGVLLPHEGLTPNYVLRSVIAQWCETHGLEVPKKPGSKPKPVKTPEYSAGERATVDHLLRKLTSSQPDMQRAAAGELRLLAKRNVENRICIADAGAIPLLVGLLSTQDLKTQEHSVTALLNLSINDNNKGAIVNAGAINPIVEVLKTGSKEARENAAATLFSLSVVDENKISIGNSGAIPALVDLLKTGTSRGKKDAATALFNLSIYQGNKARAVRAGVVAPLLELLEDANAGMVDEALAILAILATHQEGRVAIGQASAIPVLVDLIHSGSSRNKENAAAVLLALMVTDAANIEKARELGAYAALTDLASNGTTRAKRKATQLLEHMRKQEGQSIPLTNLDVSL